MSLPNISSAITINGSNFAINANNSRSIFTVDKGARLKLNRVNLRNGYTKDSRGAALVNHGATTISGGNITGNSAGKDGGAIFNKGTLTINNSALSNNSSSESGGAIRNDGMLTINNSNLRNNKASEEGGAIRNKKGTLRLTGGTFSDNAATHGGAISNTSTADITRAVFDDNTATCVGGAIHNSGDSISVSSSNSFKGNSPDTCHGVDCGSGAAKPVEQINYNLIRKGELGCSSAYDLYSFSGKKDDIVKIEMERESGTIAPALSLWNSAGKKLTEDANTSTEQDALIANYKLPSTGTYTISANNNHDGAGSYFIQLTKGAVYVLPDDDAKKIAEGLPGFHTSEQLDKAVGKLKAVALATCDMVSTLGLSSAAQLQKVAAKEVIKHVVEDLVVEGALQLNDYNVEQIRRARDNGTISELIPKLATALKLVAENFPTGPCSLAYLAQDVLVGDALLEMMDEIIGGNCEIYSDKTVLAHNWPSSDGGEIAQLFLSKRVQPTGVVQLDGAPRFYMVHGKFGGKAPVFGIIPAVFGSADSIAAVFIHEDYVTESEACQHAIDLTDLVKRMSKPQSANEYANPYIVAAINPESGDCDISIFGLYALFETWAEVKSPPVRITNTERGESTDVWRVHHITQFDGSRGSLYVQLVDGTEKGWLYVSQNWGTSVTEKDSTLGHKGADFEKCYPGITENQKLFFTA